MMPVEVHHSTEVQKGPPAYSSAFTVRADAQPTGVGEGLALNHRYFATIPGALKLLQVIFAIICMVCISPPVTWFSRLLTFIIAYSFAITVLLIFAYLVTLRNAIFPTVHWDIIELIYTGLTAIGYFIVSIIHISLTNRDEYEVGLTYYDFYGGYIAAGVFGLLNSLAYGAGTYFLYNEWRRSRQSAVTPAPNY